MEILNYKSKNWTY